MHCTELCCSVLEEWGNLIYSVSSPPFQGLLHPDSRRPNAPQPPQSKMPLAYGRPPSSQYICIPTPLYPRHPRKMGGGERTENCRSHKLRDQDVIFLIWGSACCANSQCTSDGSQPTSQLVPTRCYHHPPHTGVSAAATSKPDSPYWGQRRHICIQKRLQQNQMKKNQGGSERALQIRQG